MPLNDVTGLPIGMRVWLATIVGRATEVPTDVLVTTGAAGAWNPAGGRTILGIGCHVRVPEGVQPHP